MKIRTDLNRVVAWAKRARVADLGLVDILRRLPLFLGLKSALAQQEKPANMTILVTTRAQFDGLAQGSGDPATACLVVDGSGMSLMLNGGDEGWIEKAYWPAAPVEANISLNRGDDTPLVLADGQPIITVSSTGEVNLRLPPDAAKAVLDSVAKDTRSDTAGLAEQSEPIPLNRGDAMSLVDTEYGSVLTVNDQGEIGLRLDQSSQAALAKTIDLPGGRFETPDALKAYDAWNVRRDGDLLFFTALYSAAYPRGYMKYKHGDPWAESVSEVELHLLYGDELADTPVLHETEYFAHIPTLHDGFAQEGLDGHATDQEAHDIDRAGAGFAALAADTTLRHSKRNRPWIGVRSEACLGADFDELTDGQPFKNLAAVKEKFTTALAPYRKYPAVDKVSLLQGQADDSPDYKERLLALCRKIVAETGTRQINLFQPAGTALDGKVPSVLGVVEAFRERGDLPLVLVAPLYACERRPSSMCQPEADDMARLAELAGHATRDWLPPLAFQALYDGVDIVVDFEVQDGFDLVAPTHGLIFVDAATDMLSAIADIRVEPDPLTQKKTRLRLIFDTPPMNGGVLRYAYDNLPPSRDLSSNRYCNFGNLRDSWEMPSISGQTLYRYAMSFEFKLGARS